MNSFTTKSFAAFAVLAILLSSLAVFGTACADTKTTVPANENAELFATKVLNIGGVDIPYEYYRYYYLGCKRSMDNGSASYWTEHPEEKETLKEKVLENLKFEYSIRSYCREYGIAVTAEQQSQIESLIQQNDAYAKSSYGITFAEYVENYYMTLDFYRSYYAYQNYLSAALFDYFCDEENGLLKTDNAAEIAESAKDFVRVKHILVGTDKEGAEELAESIRSQLKELEDTDLLDAKFDELAKAHNDDTGEDLETGYYMTYGEMVEEFEEAAFALEIGEVSDVVKSSYGYHIIIRYKMEDEYITKNIYPVFAMTDYVEKKAESIEVTFSDFYNNLTPETAV